MKKNSSYQTAKHNVSKSAVLLALIFTLVLTLSACSTSVDSSEVTSMPEETVQETPTAEVVEETPEVVEETPVVATGTLSESDLTLSLEGYGAKGVVLDQDLSIADMLMYAVEDEYLAHGEYTAIIEKFGNETPYVNIVSAEETHLSLLKDIYLAYGMDFPEDDSADHIVIPADLLEAAQTGVQAEIDNIAMYEDFMTYDLPTDIEAVFSSLKSGSDSHLLAFQKQVDKLS